MSPPANMSDEPKNPPPIPCAGARDYYGEFDCGYVHAGIVGCERCVVTGGLLDPRTGRRYKNPECGPLVVKEK